MAWSFPSVKQMSRLPSVDVVGVNRIQTYLDWFDAHKELTRLVPPLYENFTLHFTRSYYDPRRDKGPRVYDYLECVHYYPGLSTLEICHVLDGKKILTVSADYAQFDGPTMRGVASAPASSPYTHAWLQNEGMSVLATVIAVQLYILYHKPDIQPICLDAPAKRQAAGGSPSTRARTIKNTVHKIIRLSAEDDAKDPIQRHYHKIQWSVRGHYRRITGKDGKEKLTYVRPHTAGRGQRKKKAGPISLIDPPKEEKQ